MISCYTVSRNRNVDVTSNMLMRILQVLRLFTASQLEIAVAGEPEFDIAFWKERTDYKGYRPDDTTVELFWKVSSFLSVQAL